MGMIIYLRRASPHDIERLTADPGEAEAFAFEHGAEGELIEFDKAWHALHFLLTGEPYGTGHPLGIIADEVPMMGTDENGLGGFSVVEPERMARFAAALAGVDDATLATRYDPQAMLVADIYIADAFVEDGREEALEYIFQGLPSLRRFATACASAGDGAIRLIA